MNLESYTLPQNPVHENDNYVVYVSTDMGTYGIVNLKTSVVEFECSALPEAIFAAENLNVVLVHKTYEWVMKRANQKEEGPTGDLFDDHSTVTPIRPA